MNFILDRSNSHRFIITSLHPVESERRIIYGRVEGDRILYEYRPSDFDYLRCVRFQNNKVHALRAHPQRLRIDGHYIAQYVVHDLDTGQETVEDFPMTNEDKSPVRWCMATGVGFIVCGFFVETLVCVKKFRGFF